MEFSIRDMEVQDWKEVAAIYASGIATGFATFETSVPDWSKWDKDHLPFARIVATEKEVIGWASLTAVSNRCVYGGVAEVSVYVSKVHRGKGVGKKLLNSLIAESEKNGIWTLQAGIFSENIVSIKLHESVGFRIIGYRERIGKLNDLWKDTVLLEKRSKVIGVDY